MTDDRGQLRYQFERELIAMVEARGHTVRVTRRRDLWISIDGGRDMHVGPGMVQIDELLRGSK